MPIHDDEMDLWALWVTIWSGRWLTAAIIAVCTSCGIAYAVFGQEWYKAEVVLTPADQQSTAGGALGGLGLGGLASLAGINLSDADKQAVAVLRSKEFARDFIVDLNLTPELLTGIWAGSEPLDIRDAVKVFDTRIRVVTENTRTGLVTLSIRWKNPDTAALWANTLAKRVNDRLRSQAIVEAQRNVDYLQKEVAATNVVSLRQSLSAALESETKKLMLARGNEQFAFKVIDTAVAPKQLDAPKRVLVILASILVSAFLSVVVLMVRNAIRNRARLQSRSMNG